MPATVIRTSRLQSCARRGARASSFAHKCVPLAPQCLLAQGFAPAPSPRSLSSSLATVLRGAGASLTRASPARAPPPPFLPLGKRRNHTSLACEGIHVSAVGKHGEETNQDEPNPTTRNAGPARPRDFREERTNAGNLTDCRRRGATSPRRTRGRNRMAPRRFARSLHRVRTSDVPGPDFSFSRGRGTNCAQSPDFRLRCSFLRVCAYSFR